MGTICRDILSTWILCTLGNGDISYINETEQIQNQREKDLFQLNKILSK